MARTNASRVRATTAITMENRARIMLRVRAENMSGNRILRIREHKGKNQVNVRKEEGKQTG